MSSLLIPYILIVTSDVVTGEAGLVVMRERWTELCQPGGHLFTLPQYNCTEDGR